ncbi:MAG TPA: tagaturonate epimerase family protein, partial [Trueperaceae bacterium]|nr:tagaturonate epimerase family protein [Trueperaceae bacterium]
MTRTPSLPADRLVSPGATLYPASRTDVAGAVLALERGPFGKRLLLAADPGSGLHDRFDGVPAGEASGVAVLRCPLTAANAAALRDAVPDLAPRPLGLTTSAGFGDRLGIATPGHARALGRAGAAGGLVAPIFAQQSIREMTRTRRSPSEVLADATWGAFEAGWRGPLGADADHLKTAADVDACLDAGFSFFTIDPGEHVDDGAADLDEASLSERLDALPWEALDTARSDLEKAYVGRRVELESETLTLTKEQVWRAAAKYGGALAHVAALHRHLLARKDADAFDFEVSVDETDTPTSP